jgi:hypothetical protein
MYNETTSGEPFVSIIVNVVSRDAFVLPSNVIRNEISFKTCKFNIFYFKFRNIVQVKYVGLNQELAYAGPSFQHSGETVCIVCFTYSVLFNR